MLTVFRRELASYFASPIAALFLLLFLLATLSHFFWISDYFAYAQADMRGVFGFAIPTMFVLFVPAITMRMWAEERRQGTEELLMTLPVPDLGILAAKYFAAVCFILVALALTFPIPLTLALTVDPTIGVDWGPIATGYLGALLLGASYLAIGSLLSALTRHQIVAFLVSLTVLLLLMVPRLIASQIPDLSLEVQRWILRLSIPSYTGDLAKGVLNLRDITFFLSLITFFLYLNFAALQQRRWG